MSEFKITFRGVRGSYPIAKKEFLEYGGNTSCVEFSVTNSLFIKNSLFMLLLKFISLMFLYSVFQAWGKHTEIY